MSLTDDWKAKKLKKGCYFWVLPVDGYPMPGILNDYNNFEVFGAYYYPNEDRLTILALCDYEELKRVRANNEIAHLRQLLKECQVFFEEENPKDFTVISERMEDLLTKINEVLK